MIREKRKLTGNLNVKQSLSGSLSNSVIYVEPITQEKEVTPTKEIQEITPDTGYTGLSKVKVNGYTIKTAEKTIVENGTYDALKENLDGYSKIKVAINNSIFSGSYDRQGLKQIGWTDEEIDYYNQNGVQWNASEDEYFKLTQTELAGDNSTNTRFIPKNSTKKSFESYYKLLAIPLLNTSKVTTMGSMFYNCRSLTTIPQLNTSKVTSMGNMFYSCYSLTTIPQLDTSEVTNMRNMFNSCCSLTTIPQLDTSKVTDMVSMFYNCYSLKTIPQLNTSKVTSMVSMFSGCYSLKTIPQLNTSKVTKMGSMFNSCCSLTTIPQLDTSEVTDMVSVFNTCYSLTTIPQLDTSKVTSMVSMFSGCYALSNLGGFRNLGQAYLISQSANYNNYTLDLSHANVLTEQSIINVLNNLYDIKTKGCQSQKVVLGSTNLAKLTSEEGQQALSNAQAKGWTIS